jgi:hypothetical protein
MLIFENKEQKLINLLKFTGSPFKKFVSTGEIEENVDLVPSRQGLLNKIVNTIEKDENFILPVIAGVGTGKTHLYWALKHELYNYNVVYISLENVYRKFFYNTYSEFIENMGVEVVRSIANRLCNEWGAQERKFGFFHVADIEKVRKFACERWASELNMSGAIEDVINAVSTHQLDPYKKVEAERWILGELMNVRELSRLNLMNDLREKKTSFAMLKVLIENSMVSSVLFIDEFEKILPILRPSDDETEEVFDPSWLYGEKSPSEKISAEKILDKILQLNEINGLRIVITLKSQKFYEEIKNKIEEKNKSLVSLLKEPLYMSGFVEEDVKVFYKQNLEYFFRNINYIDYFSNFQNSYFPLTESNLKFLFKKTQGNPRELIKQLTDMFNKKILFTEGLGKIFN